MPVVTSASVGVALVLAGGGNTALVVAAATAAAGDSANQIAPWIQGGGSAAAVAGLVYVARLVIKGDLVPRAVADRENEMAATIRVQADRERKMEELLGEALAREKTGARLGGEMVQSMATVVAELRWWQGQRKSGKTVSLPLADEGGSR